MALRPAAALLLAPLLAALLIAMPRPARGQAPVATRVWTPGATGVAGDSVRLDAWLMRQDETAYLPGQTLAFSVGGTQVGSATTDASGRASVFYAIPAGSQSPLAFAVSFAGSTSPAYAASSTTGTLTLVAIPPTRVYLDNAASAVGENVSLRAWHLRSDNYVYLAGKTLSFTVGGYAAGSAITDATGSATVCWTVPEGLPSPSTISVAFAGEAGYSACVGTANLTLVPLQLSGVSLSPTSLVGGAANSTGTVTLNRAAPCGGTVVSLTSSSPTVASVPASVTVPEGHTSATFSVTTSAVTASTAVTLTATWAGTSQTATLTVLPQPKVTDLTMGLRAIFGGQSCSAEVTLDSPAASPSGSVVALSSSDPTVHVPASLTVAAGQTTGTLTVSADAGTSELTATLTATAGGASAADSLDVYPPVGLNAVTTGSGKITLYWTGVAGATGYNVYRGLSASGPWSKLPASPVNTLDPGPGLTNTYMHSDTGLSNGTEYFYYVAAVMPGGAEGQQSERDSARPSTNAIPWDTGSATAITAAAHAMVSASMPFDPLSGPEVGPDITVGGPDGVLYEYNSVSASYQALAARDYIDVAIGTMEGSDGTATAAPLGAEQYAAPLPPPSVDVGYDPVRSVGLGPYRKVESRRYVGLAGISSVVVLPDPANCRLHNTSTDSDGAHVETGGNADGRNEVDANLQLTCHGASSQLNPGWQMVLGGTRSLSDPNGHPTRDTSKSSDYVLPGSVRLVFRGPGSGVLSENTVSLTVFGPIMRQDPVWGTRYVYSNTVFGYVRGWRANSQYAFKRVNSISQRTWADKPGQRDFPRFEKRPQGLDPCGAYAYGGAWGDVTSEPDGLLHLDYLGDWVSGLTRKEGTMPQGSPLVSKTTHNEFFFETNINLKTRLP